MTHFGIISPPVPGHIHPFAALGRELIARGHRVTYLQMLDLEDKIRSEGLDFEAIGTTDHPRGSLPASLDALGRLKGLPALRFTIQAVAKTTLTVCREAPDAIRRLKIDALLVDQMEPAGGAVADHLGMPFVTICNALPMNRDPVAPPAFSPWGYRQTPLASVRNTIGYAVSDWLTHPITRVVAEYRARWKLAPLASPDDSFSTLAQISQMPREFDFPRVALPPHFHYVGPLRRTAPRAIAFPWEKLDGRPIVYASLGTLQNSREAVFRCFAEACRDFDVQLVISHGGGLTDAQASNLPGAPLAVRYAPQETLLERAHLTLTHAGLNTVLDSLAHGVPLVAVPITYEQPSIARRVEWHACGESISLPQLNLGRLRARLASVMRTPRYRGAAARMRAAISASGGVEKTTVLVESAVKRYSRG
jgi:zeaxanthin glucosyltransferase